MGKKDILTKDYLSDDKVFADAFNYLIYDGREVIQPDELQTLDITEIALNHGMDLEVEAIQKYRDVLKEWSFSVVGKQFKKVAFVVLGIENQTHVDYAMPVRTMLYDALQYEKQVARIRATYKNRRCSNSYRLTSEEFLSGFRKEDKLRPVITLVIYFGAQKWDGPMSIYDMSLIEDENFLAYISNYKINLIEPAGIADDLFTKFKTGLGPVLMCMKHSKDEDLSVLGQSVYKSIDIRTAYLIKELANLEIDLDAYKDERGTVDMCEAYENTKRIMTEKGRMEGKSEGRFEVLQKLRENGFSIEDIGKMLGLDESIVKQWLG